MVRRANRSDPRRSIYVLLVSVALPLVTCASMSRAAEIGVKIIFDQRIEMRDGIELSARVWMPAEFDAPLPTVFVLTPYVSDESQKRGTFFAKHGYAYASVDVRGRGNSEGEFNPPGRYHAQDIHDAMAWMAEQPWSDGRFVMRGGSYRGLTQWQAIMDRHEGLRSIVPTAAYHPKLVYFVGGIPKLNSSWFGLVSGSTRNTELAADSEYWRQKHLVYFRNHTPYSRFWEVAGINERLFSQDLAPETYEFRRLHYPSEYHYASLDIPTLSVTGYWDGAQPSTLHYREQAIRAASGSSKGQHFLVIGPWSHGGTRYPTAELRGMQLGPASVVDMEQLHLDWYDWVLKGGSRPELLKDTVAYYVVGPNEWRYVSSLDDAWNSTQTWYLSSEGGRAHDVFHSGALKRDLSGSQQPDSIRHDPLDTSQAELWPRGRFDADQKLAYAPGGLIYHSPPLGQDTEVTGFMKASFYISLDVPDTDLRVTVYEILANGSSVMLGRDHLRARFRNSDQQEELVEPGEVNLYTFDAFRFNSRLLSKGSRLRLLLRPLHSPYYGRNFNSGGRLGYETAEEARVATITLHHSPEHPSRLELPVMGRSVR